MSSERAPPKQNAHVGFVKCNELLSFAGKALPVISSFITISYHIYPYLLNVCNVLGHNIHVYIYIIRIHTYIFVYIYIYIYICIEGQGVHTLYSPICLDIADLQMPTIMSLRYSSKHGSLEAGWSNCWACYIGGNMFTTRMQ